eukprot:TRINITY_DN73876_c0_g1_i1.p1 TRINITY_DN73876_c0_g1~~TRINITY_DN73876_c0_g1_i1.p1  ORF type:complete len:1277 (-),score=269.54 TRINITY_DN73876_c0_g1_i1:99-3929(-)
MSAMVMYRRSVYLLLALTVLDLVRAIRYQDEEVDGTPRDSPGMSLVEEAPPAHQHEVEGNSQRPVAVPVQVGSHTKKAVSLTALSSTSGTRSKDEPEADKLPTVHTHSSLPGIATMPEPMTQASAKASASPETMVEWPKALMSILHIPANIPAGVFFGSVFMVVLMLEIALLKLVCMRDQPVDPSLPSGFTEGPISPVPSSRRQPVPRPTSVSQLVNRFQNRAGEPGQVIGTSSKRIVMDAQAEAKQAEYVDNTSLFVLKPPSVSSTPASRRQDGQKGPYVAESLEVIEEGSSEEREEKEAEAIDRQLPPGPRVCIIGSTVFQDAASEPLVKALARAFAERLAGRIVVITGGMAGVQKTFATTLGSDFPALVHLLPECHASNFGVGIDVTAGTTLADRMAICGQLGNVYLSVEGGPGVAAEATAAVNRGALVLPMMSSGGASSGMFSFPACALQRPAIATEEEWACLVEKVPPEVAATAVVDIIIRHFDACLTEDDEAFNFEEGSVTPSAAPTPTRRRSLWSNMDPEKKASNGEDSITAFAKMSSRFGQVEAVKKSVKEKVQVRVKATGRLAEVLIHDPGDDMMCYKLRFLDGQVPTVDWFAKDAIEEVVEEDVPEQLVKHVDEVAKPGYEGIKKPYPEQSDDMKKPWKEEKEAGKDPQQKSDEKVKGVISNDLEEENHERLKQVAIRLQAIRRGSVDRGKIGPEQEKEVDRAKEERRQSLQEEFQKPIERTVIRIQAAWRGLINRKKLKAALEKKVRQGKENDQNKGAGKDVALQDEYQARMARAMVGQAKDVCVQDQEAALAKKKEEDDWEQALQDEYRQRMEKAVVRIQAARRGSIDRAKIKTGLGVNQDDKKTKVLEEEYNERMRQAATRIQAARRGSIDREKMKAAVTEKELETKATFTQEAWDDMLRDDCQERANVAAIRIQAAARRASIARKLSKQRSQWDKIVQGEDERRREQAASVIQAARRRSCENITRQRAQAARQRAQTAPPVRNKQAENRWATMDFETSNGSTHSMGRAQSINDNARSRTTDPGGAVEVEEDGRTDSSNRDSSSFNVQVSFDGHAPSSLSCQSDSRLASTGSGDCADTSQEPLCNEAVEGAGTRADDSTDDDAASSTGHSRATPEFGSARGPESHRGVPKERNAADDSTGASFDATERQMSPTEVAVSAEDAIAAAEAASVTLDELFVHAQKAMKAPYEIGALGNDDKLALYAHFKQATAGNISGAQPGWWNAVARYKYDHWKKLEGMDSDTAKKRYCELVDTHAFGWRGRLA